MVPLWAYAVRYPRWLPLWLVGSGMTLMAASVAAGWLAFIGVGIGALSLLTGMVIGRWRPVDVWYTVVRTDRAYHLRPVAAASAPWIPARPLMDRTGLWLVAYVVVWGLWQHHLVSGALLLALVAIQLGLRWGYPRRRRPDAVLVWRDPDGRRHHGYLIHGWGPPTDATSPPDARPGADPQVP